jgi:protoporphyrinogen oxidase
LVSGDAQQPVLILGAGLTGLSTALHLRGRPFVLVERELRVGGKARSERHRGFTFDVTGHWLHLRDPRVQALMGRLFAPGDLVEIERRTGVYTHGVMLPYPFQANLHGLPLEVVRECLVGFVHARIEEARGRPAPRTFAEFAEARFGAGIARHFFVPYNTKLWGMHPNRLTSEWVSRYIPIPDIEQLVGGAIGLKQEGLGYNVEFLYPRAGGIDALPERLRAALGVDTRGQVRTSTQVEEVDPARARVKLSGDADWLAYDRLISTIPLPELVQRIASAPPHVREAAGQLRCQPWRWLDVATRTPPPADYHWAYVPEHKYPFFRVGVFNNAVDAMAPPGGGSLYVELSDREHAPDIPAILRALTEIGAITSPEDVRFADQRDAEYAYVIFDDAYAASTRTIFEWLDAVGIRSCGRYGAWIYNSMEDSIIQGMDAAAWAESAPRGRT